MKRALPYFFFFLFSIIYFWPVLFGAGILLPTNPKTIPPWNEFESSEPSNGLMLDSLTLLYPWRVFNSNVLRSGESPTLESLHFLRVSTSCSSSDKQFVSRNNFV